MFFLFFQINLADRFHLMPVITPAYPQQNSTFNVTSSTRAIMKTALDAGLVTAQEIVLGKAGWEKLFEPFNFFGKYKHYVVLMASSTTGKDQVEWSGLVESKIRHLVGALEKNRSIELVHVNPEAFPCPDPKVNKQCSMWFIGLSFKKIEKLNINLTYDIRTFIETGINLSN